jgi:hypothetical protein
MRLASGWGVAPTTAVVCAVMSALSVAAWPGQWQIAGGVLGGGLLVGVSAWAIRGVVDGFVLGGGARPSGTLVLVKYFTRHAILALAAYGMMVRLHLDPVAMLAGVSSLVVASGIVALQRFRRVS